jgi:hypothetical protein
MLEMASYAFAIPITLLKFRIKGEEEKSNAALHKRESKGKDSNESFKK